MTQVFIFIIFMFVGSELPKRKHAGKAWGGNSARDFQNGDYPYIAAQARFKTSMRISRKLHRAAVRHV
jgi:hypothetical protein